MTSGRYRALVCLGLVIAAQACAEVFGYDEDPPVLVSCSVASDCPGFDDACKSRTCEAGACGIAFVSVGTPCNQTGSCDGAGTCAFGNGTLCSGDDQCFSTFCVDGVCCNEACTETCKVCSGQGNNGICTAIAKDTDPDNECANGDCSGSGACIYNRSAPCTAGADCKSGFCVDGVCCNVAACTVTGATCVTGECACSGTTPMVCSNVCKDVAIDENNCGQCGTTCATASNQGCVADTCQNLTWALWPMPNPPSTGLPNPSDYDVDGARGVVTDNVTKLMWKRDVESSSYTWEQAKTRCANLEFAGYDDWRLPTRIELVSLVDFTKPSPGPTIDTDAFPMTPQDVFWTSSPLAGSASSAWIVYFYYGYTGYDGVSDAYRVRCVR